MLKETSPPEDGAAVAVEQALVAFRELLTPEEIDESRDLLLDVLAAHPVGRLLAERVRERAPIKNSHELPTMGVPRAPKSDKGKARGRGR
jgi:hypothetical protein